MNFCIRGECKLLAASVVALQQGIFSIVYVPFRANFETYVSLRCSLTSPLF
jgi:hypothetical protein